MGIPVDVLTLHRLGGPGCEHYLLLRVARPEFSNADAGDADRADGAAERARRALLEAYAAGPLARECPGPHAETLEGELQAPPAGDGLAPERDGAFVDLWVAPTRHGAPWVVMGTAADEAAFWREVEADEDLAALGPLRPAARLRAFYLADA